MAYLRLNAGSKGRERLDLKSLRSPHNGRVSGGGSASQSSYLDPSSKFMQLLTVALPVSIRKRRASAVGPYFFMSSSAYITRE